MNDQKQFQEALTHDLNALCSGLICLDTFIG
ncbi:Uncharacterised protein [Legionella quinlivanii]|nr:Uncharacterised protein [Legionella quinlivanii]